MKPVQEDAAFPRSRNPNKLRGGTPAEDLLHEFSIATAAWLGAEAQALAGPSPTVVPKELAERVATILRTTRTRLSVEVQEALRETAADDALPCPDRLTAALREMAEDKVGYDSALAESHACFLLLLDIHCRATHSDTLVLGLAVDTAAVSNGYSPAGKAPAIVKMAAPFEVTPISQIETPSKSAGVPVREMHTGYVLGVQCAQLGRWYSSGLLWAFALTVEEVSGQLQAD